MSDGNNTVDHRPSVGQRMICGDNYRLLEEDKYYEMENSKQSGGLVGIITGGLILREETFYLPAVTAFRSLDYEARV